MTQTETPTRKSRAAVLFDLDGTLIDSVADIAAVASAFLGERGLPGLDAKGAVPFVGNGARIFLERALAAHGRTPTDADHTRFQEIYAAHPVAPDAAYPGVDAALHAWAAARLRLGVVTNKPCAPARKAIAASGWTSVFEVVVAGDTLDVRKPDPRMLIVAAERLGLGVDDVVFVGDTEIDAETARAAGAPFALFTDGYRKSAIEEIPHAAAFDDWRQAVAALAPLIGAEAARR